MAATTYKKLSQLIRDKYYGGKPSDDAQYSIKFFAELIATVVAECATEDAFINSNQGEMTYANNQFISTFRNISISVDSSDGRLYSALPSTPTSLPNGQEIIRVGIDGSKCLEFIPQKAQQSFAQSLIGSIPFNLYEINGSIIILKPYSPIFDASSSKLTIQMVGAVSGSDLLSSELTIPKNYEARIWDKIMARVLPTKVIQQDNINDSVSNQG